jgi:hypothetical protein
MRKNVVDIAHARTAIESRSEAYRKELQEMLVMLDEFDIWVQSSALNLAMTGPWKEWSDAQVVDSMVRFDPEALEDCGDPYVKMLVDLYEGILELRLAIEGK